MSKIGIASKEEVKFLTDVALGAIELKGVWKPVASWGLPVVIDGIDNKYGDKIPEPWQTYAETIVSKLVAAFQDKVLTEEEEADIIQYCSVILNERIDIKLLNEEDEATIFVNGLQFLAAMIRKAIKSLKEKN